MAKVILQPIADLRERILDDGTWQRQLDAMGERNGTLDERRAAVRDGWGEKYRDRVAAKGKLNTWERIERLKDDDSPFLPIGTMVNWGREFGGKPSPGAGVVTAIVE